jgi:hypothetical protein
MATLDLSNVKFPDVMGVREAALFLGMGEQYVRALARKGEVKNTLTDGRFTFKKADLEAFKNTPRVRAAGERSEGKKFIIAVKGADLQKVQAALTPLGIKLEPRYNYAKMKEYQAKSKARKATEAKNAPKPAGK